MSINQALSPGALDGVRVLDFTGVIAGPYCTRLMADVGADVVKIEPPTGDLLRGAAPRRKGRTPYFAQLNAGKSSISVDLKDPRAVELVLKLTETADVAVQNFRPGVLRKFGLGYEQMKARKPDIIYCNMSGFGQEGPSSGYSAYAPIIHASAGLDLAMISHQDGMERPLNGSIPFADYITGVHATTAIMAALFRRERTGKGEELDIAMTEVIYNVLAYELQEAQHHEPVPRAKYKALRAKDEYFVVNPLSPKNFIDLVNAVGHPEWLEKYPLHVPERTANWEKLMVEIENWASDRTAAECEQIIRDGGCPVARFRTVDEALAEEQAKFRHSGVEIDDGGGTFIVPNTPLRMNDAEARIKEKVSMLGDDNSTILRDWLGMSDGEIAELTEAGVLHQPEQRD